MLRFQIWAFSGLIKKKLIHVSKENIWVRKPPTHTWRPTSVIGHAQENKMATDIWLVLLFHFSAFWLCWIQREGAEKLGWGLTRGQREVTGRINLEWEHAVVQWGQALQPDLNCCRHLSLPAPGPSKWFLMTNWKPPCSHETPGTRLPLIIKGKWLPHGARGLDEVELPVPSSSRVGLILIHCFFFLKEQESSDELRRGST